MLGRAKRLSPGHFFKLCIARLILSHKGVLNITLTLDLHQIQNLPKYGHVTLFPWSHYRRKSKFSKYGHIIFRWIANLTLIHNRNITYSQKLKAKKLWASACGQVKQRSEYEKKSQYRIYSAARRTSCHEKLLHCFNLSSLGAFYFSCLVSSLWSSSFLYARPNGKRGDDQGMFNKNVKFNSNTSNS